MAVNYFSVFFSIMMLTIISQRGKLVDSIIFSDDFINKWTIDDLDWWFNRQLCLFRIECRVDGLLGLNCIKDSGECNKDWIINNQYWSNWNKIWIRLDYEEKPLGAKQRTNIKLNPYKASTLRDLNPTNIAGRRVLSHHCATCLAPPNPLVRPIYQES